MTTTGRALAFQFALLAVILGSSFALQTLAFSEPSSTPPSGDGYAPLNTGSVPQDKAASDNSAWITADGLGSRYGALLATQSGSVGIGTLSPATLLDVHGDVRVGYVSTTCSGTISGAIRFDSVSASTSLQYCDGVAWRTLATASCPSIAHGTSGSLPDCVATCDSGYTLQNGACTPTSQNLWGCGGSYGNNPYTCSGYTWACYGSSSASCGNAILYCRDGWSWTWTCGTLYSDGTRGSNVDDSYCGGVHPSPWTCNP